MSNKTTLTETEVEQLVGEDGNNILNGEMFNEDNRDDLFSYLIILKSGDSIFRDSKKRENWRVWSFMSDNNSVLIRGHHNGQVRLYWKQTGEDNGEDYNPPSCV